MNNKTLMDNLRCIPDFPKKGINFRDVTTLYKNAECMKIMVDEMYELYKDKGITKIVGIESRGFVMASALAARLGAGVVLARKPGKLPLPGMRIDYALEYGTESLEISKGALNPGERILIVDDLLATGGSAKALSALVEKSGASVAGIIFYIELTPLKGRELLKDYKVLSIVPVEAY
jgi:adenine phosphoribosyltransferase